MPTAARTRYNRSSPSAANPTNGSMASRPQSQHWREQRRRRHRGPACTRVGACCLYGRDPLLQPNEPGHDEKSTRRPKPGRPKRVPGNGATWKMVNAVTILALQESMMTRRQRHTPRNWRRVTLTPCSRGWLVPEPPRPRVGARRIHRSGVFRPD